MINKIGTVIFLLCIVTCTQISAQKTVPRPAECGTTHGCFSDCEGGSTCGFVVLWSVNGTNAVYNMKTSLLVTTTWMGLGFSNTTTMEPNDVIWCAPYLNGTYAGFSGHTPPRSAPIMYNDMDLTLTSSSIQNGILSCTIQRPINESANGRVNANTPWILLFAVGNTSFTSSGEPNISYHGGGNRFFSSAPVTINDTRHVGAAIVHPNTSSPTTGSKPAGCGTSIACFSDCQGSTCSFVVSWAVSGTTVTYTLTSPSFPTGGTWMAIGFSNNTDMDNDDVLGCASDASGIVKFSATIDTKRPPTQYYDTDVILTSSSVQNGTLTCSIQRPINASTTGRVNADTVWTLLFAKGVATINATRHVSISYHGTNRYWSALQARATTVIDSGAVSVHPVTPSPNTGTITRPAGCGTAVGCFYNFHDSGCSFVVSWTSDGVNAFYSFTTNLLGGSGTWIAIGFSSDAKMGDDDVMGCAADASNTVSAFTAQNNVQSSPTYRNDSEVKLTNSSVANNVLTCTVQRPVAGNTMGRRNISQPWIYLVAKGPAGFSGGQVRIQSHVCRFILDQQVSVNDKIGAGASNLDFPLIKAHGSLMIVAWIFLASIGIVLARYYKPVWTGLLCSEKVWFQVHRICMILVFCTTAAGFIIIFIQVDGYSKINEERQFLVGHPIIGIIVMILTVINPVMALFRPHPGTPRRPIFNYAHWFVGTAAHILGVVNIFFGVLLTKSDVPYYLVYILGAYVAWQIFVEILLEILTFFGRKMERSEAYEMDADGDAKKSVAVESSCTIIIKRVILIVHCIIVAGFAAALIGLLATGKAKLEDE